MQGGEGGAAQLREAEFQVLKTLWLDVTGGEPSVWVLSEDCITEIHLGDKNNVEIQLQHFSRTVGESLLYGSGLSADKKTFADWQGELKECENSLESCNSPSVLGEMGSVFGRMKE